MKKYLVKGEALKFLSFFSMGKGQGEEHGAWGVEQRVRPEVVRRLGRLMAAPVKYVALSLT